MLGHVPYNMRDAEKSQKSLDTHIAPVHDIQVLPEDSRSEILSIFDPNFDEEDAAILQEDSPYPEVRCAVANVDDPTMVASTLRVWVLGLFWSILLPGLNQFFFFRYPTVTVGSLVAQLIVFPLGRVWASVVPQKTILGIQLNPGPFTIKEHVLVTVMAGIGASTAYATEIVAVERYYYHHNWGFGFQWLLVMSTQLLGFSMGGFLRRFLVSPPSMIWPNTLVSCALFNTLHSQSYVGVGKHEGLSRERFFLFVFIGAATWYTFPGYLFQALSWFSWVTWLAPDNIKVNQLFGYRSGLGFSLITFDWNQIAFIGSPLATPWWAEANVMIGFFFFYWFLTPILYYKNVWYSQYLPMSSLMAFDNTGKQYNISRIIDQNGHFDAEAFRAYSPLYLSITFVMSYGLSFLSITATITHALIHFWKPIQLHFKRSLREQPDIHAQLMAKYPQVPEWYYGCIFMITFIFICVCVEIWPTEMPVWTLVVAILIALFYVVPIGMIQAVTNRQIGLNVITEMIIGFLLPGRPLSMMIFKTVGYISVYQAIQFTGDMKLGHYMKISPVPLFWAQILSTIVAGTTQLIVQNWMFDIIPDLCDPNQKDGFICSSIQVFGTASVIWGLIGPGLQFARNQVYYGLLFFLCIGAICPVVLWLITRRFPNTILNYANFPLIFTGVACIPPATAVNYIPWALIGFLFQFVVRRKRFDLWAKYNYVLSAALDAGTAFGVIVIYFALQYPANGQLGIDSIQAWWGNQVFKNTADWNMTALRSLSIGETFGDET